MGNVVGSVLGGVSEVLGKLLGHPLDFLSGKSCSSKCGPTWDLTCYIENFCIAQLLKLGLVFSYSSTCHTSWVFANASVISSAEAYGHAVLPGSLC
ncbi:protein HAPLESS 2 [Coffea arabica]|uniref:Protein HAPLESS 2 n=1 Tax=Coffea arabica TaxID=13443 RepID=A0A6P6UQR1_COFAR|nr:protein HAPLESS 2-like [Coffea arabica]